MQSGEHGVDADTTNTETAHLRGPGTMDQIDATALLAVREARVPDHRLECEALAALADVFANAPRQLGQALTDTAMQLTGAHAAGLSLEELAPGQRVFRWMATSGSYQRYLHETLPRDFSPCGEVLERNAPVLMRDPVQLYAYIGSLHEPVHEVLLVPFHHQGRPVGTVWVVSHDGSKTFDREDLRIVQVLTRFAAAAVQAVGSVDRLHETDRRKDQFLAMLAHEMRNPLSAISLSVQLLKRVGDDAARRRRSVEIIERQTSQLAQLVSDITDVASIRSGKIQLRREPVIMQELIARSLETCGEQLEAKKQRLELQLPEAPVAMLADPVRLTQVIVNLVNNAVKYTPEEGTIGISLRTDAGSLWLSVHDTGIGMAPEAIGHVFDMYMQADIEDRPHNSGLGIGLALVKQFVELHGGTITASSPGVGQASRFDVKLPLPEDASLRAMALSIAAE
jgi:signal transduction histidine kinase